MARAIDASRFGEIMEQWKKDCLADNDTQGADIISDVILQLDDMPTLTPPNEWVSVADRLPEKKQDVLMYFDTGNMAVGWWHDKDEHITFWCAYTDDGFYTDCDCIPAHWMPLPAPPEVEEDI